MTQIAMFLALLTMITVDMSSKGCICYLLGTIVLSNRSFLSNAMYITFCTMT